MKQSVTFLAIILLLVSLIFYACSSSEESATKEKTNGNDIYVFDEIPENNTAEENNNTNKMSYVYLIQIGAFESKINAEEFTAKSELKLGEKLDVTFNDEEKLYVVRFRRVFSTRNEAEKIRNELWQTEDFRDAWIIQKAK